jgi:autoinducer 2-degrading protein
MFGYVIALISMFSLIKIATGSTKQSTYRSLRMKMSSTNVNGYQVIYQRAAMLPNLDVNGLIGNAAYRILDSGISRLDVMHNPSDVLSIFMFKDSSEVPTNLQPLHPTMGNIVESRYRPIFPASPSQWDVDKSSMDKDDSSKRQKVELVSSPSNPSGLFAVVVDVNVLPGTEEQFINQSIHNCQNSAKESGVYRFDLLQNIKDSKNFVLVEIYADFEASVSHKTTAHYKAWAEVANPIMAIPRSAQKYTTLYPSSLYYHKSSDLTKPGEGKDLFDRQATSGSWSGLKN